MKKKLKKILDFSLTEVYERIKKYALDRRRNAKSKKIVCEYLEKEKVRKLHIGCGSNILEGWLNTDIRDDHEDIAYMDAGLAFPLGAETLDFIFSEHLLEHLKLNQQVIMLNECRRVLKKDGVLRIATPSLDFLFSLYTDSQKQEHQEYLEWAELAIPNLRAAKNINSAYSKVYVINNFFKDWGHQLIHNYQSLEELAYKNGFTRVSQLEVGQSNYYELRNLEKHGTIIPKEANDLETMVLELAK